jgi:ABC-2 type transport system permease protein
MLKGFSNILIKELKELIRDPKILIGMIVVPLIMFPVLGLVFGYAQETAANEAQNARLLVLDNDGGNWSQTFTNYLRIGINVTTVNNTTPQQAVNQGLLEKYDVTTFLEIPAGFSQNMTAHANGDFNVTAQVYAYGQYQGGSIFSGLGSTIVSQYVEVLTAQLPPTWCKPPPPPSSKAKSSRAWTPPS